MFGSRNSNYIEAPFISKPKQMSVESLKTAEANQLKNIETSTGKSLDQWTITLGAITPTYDLESEPADFKPIENITTEDLQKATLPFTGNILQTPPIHSAIKKKMENGLTNWQEGETT